MTVKNWSDLYPQPEPVPMGWGKVAFYASPGGQTAYNLSAVNADAINAITTRGSKHGRNDYVIRLGDTPIEYFAPAGAKLKIGGNEIVFTPVSMKGGPVAFEISQDVQDAAIYGVRVQSGGYFRLRLDDPNNELLGAPFTAIDLIPGVNTINTDAGVVYPPGAYIFSLDGSAGVGFDMQDRYDTETKDAQGNEVYLSQPPGIQTLQIELLQTPEPPIYAVWFDEDSQPIRTVNTADPNDVLTDTLGIFPQNLVTAERLQTILANIFAAAATDPTGEGTVYLPWKVEQWFVPAINKNNYDLRKAAVDAVNTAPRTTKFDIANYAGQLIPPADTKAAGLDCYADKSVQFTLESSPNAEGGKQLRVALAPTNPTDLMFRLLPDRADGGMRDITIHATCYFSLVFHPSNQINEELRQKIIDAQEPSGTTTMLLIDGVNMDDANNIYSPGRYVFRPYDPAGVTITLLAQTTIGGQSFTSKPNAFFAFNMIRQTGGDEFYNVWYSNSGPAKIVNDTDPQDMRTDLQGMRQVKPVLMKDILVSLGAVSKQQKDGDDALSKRIDQLKPLDIWKIETYLSNDKKLYYAVYDTTGAVTKIVSAADPKDTLPPASLNTLTKVPTFVEEEIKLQPNADAATLVNSLRNTLDELIRHAGFEDMGALSGTVDIDWSVGKIRKLVTLGGNLTLNFAKNPTTRLMMELFVTQQPGKSFTVSLSSSSAPLSEHKTGLKPSDDTARYIQIFYDGHKYYLESGDF